MHHSLFFILIRLGKYLRSLLKGSLIRENNLLIILPLKIGSWLLTKLNQADFYSMNILGTY